MMEVVAFARGVMTMSMLVQATSAAKENDVVSCCTLATLRRTACWGLCLKVQMTLEGVELHPLKVHFHYELSSTTTQEDKDYLSNRLLPATAAVLRQFVAVWPVHWIASAAQGPEHNGCHSL
jgi:hypothetical protein